MPELELTLRQTGRSVDYRKFKTWYDMLAAAMLLLDSVRGTIVLSSADKNGGRHIYLICQQHASKRLLRRIMLTPLQLKFADELDGESSTDSEESPDSVTFHDYAAQRDYEEYQRELDDLCARMAQC